MLVPSIFNDNFTDDFMDDFFPTSFKTMWRPDFSQMMQTDVKETDKSYELGISLPGYAKEDIVAELKDGYLTINAEHKENKDQQDEDGKYIRKERYSGHCSRSFFVGEDVKQEDIRAKFENGILNISVPKIDESKKVEEKKPIMIEG